jgi:hypothetical protein
MHKSLETQWEKYCNLRNAERAREDVENIIQTLHKTSNMTNDTLFAFGISSSLATLLPKEEQNL